MARKKTDPASKASKALVAVERQREESARTAQHNKEQAIAFIQRMAGKIESSNYYATQAGLVMLIHLKELKESRGYKDLGLTWVQVCENMGLKWRTVDDRLSKLKDFKVEFLTASVNFLGFDFNKIKYLGEAVSAKIAEIQDNAILYKGESIPLTPGHRDEVQAVLDQIQEDLGKQLEEKDAELRTRARQNKDNQKHIDKLTRSLDKYEKEARAKGLTPEEDAFVQQMKNLRIGFDGYMLRVDPERLDMDGNATALMRAEYLTTVWHLRTRTKAAYDMAMDMFGHDLIEGEEDWQPKK